MRPDRDDEDAPWATRREALQLCLCCLVIGALLAVLVLT